MGGVAAWGDPWLMWPALALALLMLPTALARARDRRRIGGVNVWVKPLKFEASLALHLASLGWALPLAGAEFRDGIGGALVIWGSLVPAGLEMAYIVWRAGRGEASHFNASSRAARVAFSLMGVGALLLTATAPVLAIGIAVSPVDMPPAWRLALVLGLAMTFALGAPSGMAMGGRGSNGVGEAKPGAGAVPVFGWSLGRGDLRVAHFLGLHAMQLVPLLALPALAWTGPAGVAWVLAVAGLYAVLTLGALRQALAGRPVWAGLRLSRAGA